MEAWIIVNPAAGSGRALEAGERLGRLLPHSVVMVTEGRGDATRLARLASEEAIGLVVAVGGDGTLQEITTGLCTDANGTPHRARTRLGLLPAGTGGDYQRTLGVGLSPEEAATRFCQPRTQRVDVGIVEYETHSGTKARQAFLNALSFGLGGLTTRLVDGSPKWLGGRATYLLGALRANLLHQPKPIELRIDGRRLPIAPYANVAVCLGRYFGGGMKIAPNAELDDGLFDIVTIEADRLAVAALSLDIYRGSHLRRTGVRVERAASVTASSTTGAEVLLDLDGNQPGKLPLSIELLPLGLELAL